MSYSPNHDNRNLLLKRIVQPHIDEESLMDEHSNDQLDDDDNNNYADEADEYTLAEGDSYVVSDDPVLAHDQEDVGDSTPSSSVHRPLSRMKEEVKNQAVKGLLRERVKHASKFLVKKGILLLKKGGLLLLKAIIGIIGAIKLPVLLIALAIILLVVIIFMVSSFLFNTGQDLDPIDQKLRAYIVDQANRTVNMNHPIERVYRVPEDIIIATMQLDVWSAKSEEEQRRAIRDITSRLAPIFDRDKFNEYTEIQKEVCRDGKCKKQPIKRVDNWVEKIVYVDAWDRNVDYNYQGHLSDWVEVSREVHYETETYTEVVEVEKTITVEDTVKDIEYRWVVETYYEWEMVCRQEYFGDFPATVCRWEQVPKTRTVRKPFEVERKVQREETIIVEEEVTKERQIEVVTITRERYMKYIANPIETKDFSTLNHTLNSFGFGMNDKRLIEGLYEVMTNRSLGYIDWLSGMGYGGGWSFPGEIIPGGGVPPEFMTYYLEAQERFGVDWYVLAAIHYVETNFSRHPTMISPVGAIGHMQFMPCTWVGWSYPGCSGVGALPPDAPITDLSVIAKYGGYGVDGSGNGKADPWDVQDAIHTAANYLAKSGYARNPRGAVYNYNRASWYVDKVFQYANEFQQAAEYRYADGIDAPAMTSGTFMRPATGQITSPFGRRSSGMHYGIDIGLGGRDPNKVPIVAVADGIVTRSYYSNSYGNVVFILHEINGQTFETVYAHMTHRAVYEGQRVRKGQILGNMGNTGRSTGPHLHFELHVGRWNINKTNAVDPRLYIQF